ncbi:hypothetical protein G9A89_010589 [Geosiphon pyriformis]|nr:hypothetical protein G9A89_010589 [Geosiphon pyriformis]
MSTSTSKILQESSIPSTDYKTFPSSSDIDLQDSSFIEESGRENYWLKKAYRLFGSTLYLRNDASVARDHLANERTFLAWLRTSLSLIGIGIALTQLFRFNINPNYPNDQKYGKPLGISFIIIGIFFLSFGLVRYFHIQTAMVMGGFPISRGTIIVGTFLTLASVGMCLFTISVIQH